MSSRRSRFAAAVLAVVCLGSALAPSATANPTRPTDNASELVARAQAQVKAKSALRVAVESVQPVDASLGTVRAAGSVSATAGGLGRVASKQRPLMPSDGQMIYRPGFPTLPFGTGGFESTTPQINYTLQDRRAVWLAYNFNAAPIPTAKCRPPVATGLSDAQLVTQGTAYANCLFDAWRPFAAAHKVTLPKLSVYSCAITRPGVGNPCGYDDGTWAMMAMPDARIFMSKNLRSYVGGIDFAIMISHEAVHELQGFMTNVPGEPALTMGIIDFGGDGNGYSRRMELQAQCLGVAQVVKAKPMTFSDVEQAGQVFSADPMHWDYERVVYWTKRAVKAQVAGDCNAMVAAPSLVVHQG